MRSRQRTFCSTRTNICGRGLCEKRSPGCVQSVVDERKIVQYGTIKVRPRSSYDVNSNPKQTQRSNMGSIPGKHTSVSRMQSLAECFRNQVVSASVALNRERLASLVSTTD